MKLISNLLRAYVHIPRMCTRHAPVYFSSNTSIKRFFSSEGLPKHRVLNLPALSPTMENGNLVSWSVKEGDRVDEGDVLADIETDKAVVSFEIVDGGYVAKLLVEQGTKQIPLGTPVCILVDSQEDVEKFKGYTTGGEVGASPPAPDQHSIFEPIQSGSIASHSESSPSAEDSIQVMLTRDIPARETSTRDIPARETFSGYFDKQLIIII